MQVCTCVCVLETHTYRHTQSLVNMDAHGNLICNMLCAWTIAQQRSQVSSGQCVYCPQQPQSCSLPSFCHWPFVFHKYSSHFSNHFKGDICFFSLFYFLFKVLCFVRKRSAKLEWPKLFDQYLCIIVELCYANVCKIGLCIMYAR